MAIEYYVHYALLIICVNEFLYRNVELVLFQIPNRSNGLISSDSDRTLVTFQTATGSTITINIGAQMALDAGGRKDALRCERQPRNPATCNVYNLIIRLSHGLFVCTLVTWCLHETALTSWQTAREVTARSRQLLIVESADYVVEELTDVLILLLHSEIYLFFPREN